MRKKIITYFTILSVCILVFSIVINKIIIDKKFPLKTNDLKGLEELTSKVFIFTTHNNNQKMDHMKLIHGLGFSNYFKIMIGKSSDKLVPLLEFALGVEVAQVIIVLAILLIGSLSQSVLGVNRRDWILVVSSIVIGFAFQMMINRVFW